MGRVRGGPGGGVSAEDALPAKYVEVRVIGSGSHGTAHLVECREDGQLYVNKRIDIKTLPERERLAAASECAILSSMRHPNVLEAKESFFDAWGCLNFVTQYCEGGDLHQRVVDAVERGAHFSEAEVMDYFVQVAGAVRYIHGRRTLHRDLKTQNVFLRRDGTLRLGDFGIAKVLERTQDFATTVAGTPYYMSPEVCENKSYTSKSDIWALGCMLYELCALRHAFDAPNILGLVLQIVKGDYAPIPTPRYSDGLARLVDAMLRRDPDERPSADDIVQSPFVQEHLRRFCKEHGVPIESIVPTHGQPEAERGDGHGMTARERLQARKLAVAVERERQLAEAARHSLASREEARQRYSHEFYADYLSPRPSEPAQMQQSQQASSSPGAQDAGPRPEPLSPARFSTACEWLDAGHNQASQHRPLEYDPLRNVSLNWETLEYVSRTAGPSFFTQSHLEDHSADLEAASRRRGDPSSSRPRARDGQASPPLDREGDSPLSDVGTGAYIGTRAPAGSRGWLPGSGLSTEGGRPGSTDSGRGLSSDDDTPIPGSPGGLGLGRMLDSLKETVRSESPDPATLPTLASMLFGSEDPTGSSGEGSGRANPTTRETDEGLKKEDSVDAEMIDAAMHRILMLREFKQQQKKSDGAKRDGLPSGLHDATASAAV